jgi:hypothetical protein
MQPSTQSARSTRSFAHSHHKHRLKVAYDVEPLASEFQKRLADFFDPCFLRKLLDAGVIAGGFVANLLTTGSAPGDIDVFILNSDRAAVTRLLEHLDAYFQDHDRKVLKDIVKLGYYIPSNTIVGHFKSVITVYHPSVKVPIQIVFTDKPTIQDLLTTFDLDYVQCGLIWEEDQIKLVRSTLAQQAHDSRKIHYYQWSSRLRMKKAQAKGFAIPQSVNRGELESIVLKEPEKWNNESVREYLNTGSSKVYESVTTFIRSNPEMPPFHRDTYMQKAQSDLITDYEFIWDSKVSPTTHRQIVAYTISEDPIRRRIYHHLLMGQPTEALVMALYQRQKRSEDVVTVTPSMLLRAPDKSLEDMVTTIESLLT